MRAKLNMENGRTSPIALLHGRSRLNGGRNHDRVSVDPRQLTPDTSGSVGIAAALTLRAQQGWLDALGGVAQTNKGGECLQCGTYRVIHQMGMGLMA